MLARWTSQWGRSEVFGSNSELLFARSQLPHWWLPLPRLAPVRCVSSATILQEGKNSRFLVMAVSDGVLAHVINSAQSYHRGGLFYASRRKGLQAKVKNWTSLYISYTNTFKDWIYLFLLLVKLRILGCIYQIFTYPEKR